MATYIPGAKQYVPNAQPFTPDYKFLSNVLQTKENRYDAGYKALNDIYGKVVYADLSRSDTREVRDQFANQLGPKLEKISGLDLSLSQNVQAAKGIFQPFFEEDLIVRDLVNTQAFRSQMNRANRLNESIDEDQRRLYWQEGVEYLQYKMEDFINASPEEALNMGPVKYIENPDLYQRTLDFLDEQELNISRDIFDPTGRYIITTNTGEDVTQAAIQMAYKSLSNDPRVIEGYFADAYVRSRRYADQAIQDGVYSSVPEARKNWAIDVINASQAELGARLINQLDAVTESEANLKSWEKYKEKYGIVPGSKYDMEYRKTLSIYQTLVAQAEDTASALEEDTALKTTGSVEGLTNRAFNMLMQMNLRDDITAAVQQHMKLNEQIEIKADEYAKMQQQYMYDVDLIQRRFANDKEMQRIKAADDKALELLKAELEGAGSSMLSAFDVGPRLGGAGATSYAVDEEGKAADPKDYDYISANTRDALSFAQKNYQEEVNAVLNFIDKSGKYKNGYFKHNGTNYTSKTLAEYLLQTDENGNFINAKEGEALFDEYYTLLTDANGIGLKDSTYPALANDPEALSALNTMFETVNARKQQLEQAILNSNKSYQDILATALTTEDGKGLRDKAEKYDINIPSIITNRNGVPEVLSYDEFLSEYEELLTEAYLNDAGYSITGNTDYNPLPSIYKNRQILLNRASKEVQEIYDTQRDLINGAIGGVLSVDPQKGDVSAQVYQPFSVNSYMYNQPQTAGDIFVGPVYEATVSPLDNNPSNVEALRNYNRQVSMLGEGEAFYHSGDVGKLEDITVEENDPVAEEIAKRWNEAFYANVISGSKNENAPTAGLTYAPIYGPRDENNKTTAGYTMSYNPKWVATLEDKIDGLTDDNLSEYTTVTLLFDQSKDLNPRRLGSVNFSPYLTYVNQADNNLYKRVIPGGGEFEIQLINGEYRMITKSYHFDEKKGDLVTLDGVTINLTQEANTRGQSVEEFTNQAVEQQYTKLYQFSSSNNEALRKFNNQ